jgi:hypothetical protein
MLKTLTELREKATHEFRLVIEDNRASSITVRQTSIHVVRGHMQHPTKEAKVGVWMSWVQSCPVDFWTKETLGVTRAQECAQIFG